MKNKFWQAFIQGFISVFRFSTHGKIRIKNAEIDNYFIKAAYYINNGYEKLKDE